MKAYIRQAIIKLFSLIIKLFVKKDNLTINKLLIIAPHPDDEILGLGGLILQTIKNGGKVFLIYLTDGEESGVWSNKDIIRNKRIELTNLVCERLGIPMENVFRMHLPDGKVPPYNDSDFSKTVQNVVHLIDTIKPEAVFATSESDYWPFDHVACSQIAKSAVQVANHNTTLWFYWVWTWYHLMPWSFKRLNFKSIVQIDISKQLKQKKDLMDIYLCAKTPQGKPWSGVLPFAMLYPFNKPFEIVEKYKDVRK